MDTLTHTVLGACLGEAIAGKKLGKKAMLYGAIANNLPDADVAASLWTDHAENMLVHRGITHSILIAVLLTPALAYWFRKRHPELSLRECILLWGTGLFSHIFIDAYTSYGTGWFEPFSETRVTFNALYIVDPVFTIPMVIATIALLILKRDSPKRMRWMKAGLYISAVYLLLVSINKLYINSVIKENIEKQNLSHSKFMATPTPLNNFLWYVVIDSDDDLYTGYYSDFDKTKYIDLDTIRKNDSLLLPYKTNTEVSYLIRFSQDYYCLKKQDTGIIFNDLRFGSQGGWYKKDAPFVFRYDISEQGENAIALQEGRMNAIKGESLKKLWERMKGK
jgi:inner membrane protein